MSNTADRSKLKTSPLPPYPRALFASPHNSSYPSLHSPSLSPGSFSLFPFPPFEVNLLSPPFPCLVLQGTPTPPLSSPALLGPKKTCSAPTALVINRSLWRLSHFYCSSGDIMPSFPLVADIGRLGTHGTYSSYISLETCDGSLPLHCEVSPAN